MSYSSKTIHQFKIKKEFKNRILQKIRKYGRIDEGDRITTLDFIAGPNGAGKSQYVSFFYKNDINWDEDLIYQEISNLLHDSEYLYEEIDIEKIVSDLRKEIFNLIVENNQKMVFHTNFSAHFLHSQGFKDYFNDKIFDVSKKLIFIDTIYLQKSIDRVNKRKLNGGHDVDIDDIKQNFDLSVKNIVRHLQYFEEIIVHTNAIEVEDLNKLIIAKKLRSEEVSLIQRDIPIIHIISNKCEIRHDALRNQFIYERYALLIKELINQNVEISIL